MKKLVFFSFIAILWLNACQKPSEPRFVLEEEVGKDIIYNFEMLYSDSAILKVKIKGDRMFRAKGENKDNIQIFPEGITAYFYNERKEITATLSSKYAIRSEREKTIIVRDSVVWRSVKDETLETEELTWDEEEEKIFTSQFVTINQPDRIIYSYGFESDQNFTYSKLNSPEAFIKVQDNVD